ncbi:Ig domain-containing protein [Nannocystis bainbridge]|uniref:Ig domain-containing protein n=1 Tax=Nannocystis bainbridge TaxID=2995303 RepID=A0ABT5DV40_9BACT|nr:Ig domain-containing protein [Nannocystis bainbridge]MDC0717491.1 Ig domain-containing protein [Nannocystis bainbridge]
MRRFASEGRERRVRLSGPGWTWMLVLGMSALSTACGDDDAAGGGSYVGSATQTTEPPATTTDADPTSSSTDAPTTTTNPATTDAPTTTTATTDEPPPALVVDCGALPKGAQGAEYEHQPTASGGVPKYTWSASGLPDGLAINAANGEISGVPTMTGEFVVELTVTDLEDHVAVASCPALTIGDQLTVDYDALAADGPCVAADSDKTILDYITGGDGSPITCATPAGTGDGKVPAGLGVDAKSCEITGTIGESRYGNWAWIVAAEQSGVKVFAPYCAKQTQQAPKAYAIVGNHSGETNNALEPMLIGFDPDQPLRFDGDADPRFEVKKASCGDSCFFGFLYRVSMSPFGTGDCKSDKDGCFGLCPLVADGNEPDGDKAIQCSLLPLMGTPKTGFAHEMWAKGDVVPDEFKTRPFVVQWSIDYCLSNQAPDCQGKDAILGNGDNSNFEFPVIFRPQ